MEVFALFKFLLPPSTIFPVFLTLFRVEQGHVCCCPMVHFLHSPQAENLKRLEGRQRIRILCAFSKSLIALKRQRLDIAVFLRFKGLKSILAPHADNEIQMLGEQGIRD